MLVNVSVTTSVFATRPNIKMWVMNEFLYHDKDVLLTTKVVRISMPLFPVRHHTLWLCSPPYDISMCWYRKPYYSGDATHPESRLAPPARSRVSSGCNYLWVRV